MSFFVLRVQLLVSCILLLCSKSSANTRTCFTQLQFIHGIAPVVTYADIADDEHSGFVLGCDDAEILCWNNMLSHVEESLGNGVAYIRNNAASSLCNTIQREILPGNPTHVYVNWIVSNCGRTGRMYLGQICCWRYYVGPQAIYVNNPECTQCEKPDCEHNRTSTQQTGSPNVITAAPLTLETRDPNPVISYVGGPYRQKEDNLEESSNSKILHDPSAKRQGFSNLGQDENKEAEPSLKIRKEKHLKPGMVELLEEF